LAGVRRRAPEAAFHITVSRYLTFALPPQFFWTTFPSGGGGFIRGANLKRMGLKPGMPDLVIFDYGGFLRFGAGEFIDTLHYPHGPALWLELKAKTGSLSREQRQVHKALKALGHRVVVVKTIPQVEAAVAEFIFPNLLRARLR